MGPKPYAGGDLVAHPLQSLAMHCSDQDDDLKESKYLWATWRIINLQGLGFANVRCAVYLTGLYSQNHKC